MSDYWRAPVIAITGRLRPPQVDAEFLAEWQRHKDARLVDKGKGADLARLHRRLEWLDTTKTMQAEPSRERGGVPTCSLSGAPVQGGSDE